MGRSALWLSMVAVLFPVALGPVAAQTPNTNGGEPSSRTITVSASADVRAVPDTADIQLGVMTRNSNAQAAMAKNNAVMQQVVAALRQLGIPDTNLQTSSINLQPVYDNRPSPDPTLPPQLIGFEASNVLTAELTDLTKVGPAIDAGVTAGANQIQGISFRVFNDQPLRIDALKQASTRARAKAEAIAAGLGVTLGDVDAAAEGVSQVTPVNSGAVAPTVAAPSVPVLPGQVVIHADVAVRFLIK